VSFDPYLFFDGNCRAALSFYAEVFGGQPGPVMTYGQMPGGPAAAADRERILYATLPAFGVTIMFSDRPSGTPHVVGSHLALSLGTADPAEVRRVFAALAEGGRIDQPLGPQFFSPLYGMVTDRFGVLWMVNLSGAETATA
jgi:PhnB protein